MIAKFSKPIDAASAPDNPRVMLISLACGALGLNLTVASQVILCGPWWQDSIEMQAVDRVYRIGQKKPVSVFQIISEETIEDKVLAIAERKNMLIAQVSLIDLKWGFICSTS